MQYALFVRVVNRFRDQLHVTRGLRRRQRAVADELREVLTLDQVHREKVLAFVHPDLVNRNDVWVLQNPRGGGLAAKSLCGLLAGQVSSQNHFYGHDAVEGTLAGPIDDAHPAAGDLLDEFVIAEASEADLASIWTRR